MTRAEGGRWILRGVAVAIAAAGALDPPVAVERVPPRVVTVATATATDAGAIRSALQRAAGADVVLRNREGRDGALPCESDAGCVVIADGTEGLELQNGKSAPLFLLRLPPAPGPNVQLLGASAASRQDPAAAGSIRLDLHGAGVTGRSTEIRVLDGSIVVGASRHEWTGDGEVQLDVAWWPIREGARVLRAEAIPVDGETAVADNVVDVGVVVQPVQAAVLVFDPRPSWASTFARRALEADPRFVIRSRARLGPSLTAGTLADVVDARALQRAEVAIIGSPNALSAGEVALLDRYVRVRGGTLILLPDQPPAGDAARLFSGGWQQHLTPTPSAVGSLRATEILRRPATDPTDLVLAESDGMPAIVMSPAGAGRVVVVGAMDAWRYRDDEGGTAFAGFWRSLALRGAALGAALSIDAGDPLAVPGATLPVTIRVRRMEAAASESLGVVARCDEGTGAGVRARPTGEAGVFVADWPIGNAARCELEVTAADGARASTAVAVARRPSRGTAATLARFERLAAASGGETFTTGDEAALAERLRAGERGAIRTSTHPMRSPWWIVAFAGCLAVEWWLRRRTGLR